MLRLQEQLGAIATLTRRDYLKLLHRLNYEEYFGLLRVGLILEHLLHELDHILRIKDRVVLFVHAALNHLQVQLVVDEALEQIGLEVEQLELLLHPALRDLIQVDADELGDRLLDAIKRGAHLVGDRLVESFQLACHLEQIIVFLYVMNG